jgi:hypothetical protein
MLITSGTRTNESMLPRARSHWRTCAMPLCFFLANAPGTLAAITNISVAGVTNTQAILTWTAPDAQPCKVQVSESANLTPLVHDVDPAIFPGSNMDNRDGSITDQRMRKFVIGKRTAEKGSDGFRYSRALQSYTPHFFQITCSSDQATGQFRTQQIAFGNTFQDPPPVDEAGGGYAWPDLSPTDRKQTIVDPQTGALIRRVSMVSDRIIPIDNEGNMLAAGSGGWANAVAAASNRDNGAAATISRDNHGMLRIAPGLGSYFTGNILSDVGSKGSVNYFQLALTASISNPACNNSRTDDCKIVVCLSIDGVNCRVGGNQYEQALRTNPQTYLFGTKKIIDLWQAPGYPPISAIDAGTRNGSVVCDGSINVNLTGGAPFNTAWGQGSSILINNVRYTIASVINNRSVTVTRGCASTNGPVGYTGYNFGALIRKKTASPDTVAVEYGTVSYELGIYPFPDYSGDFDMCGPVPVVGPTGNPGYNCAGLSDGPMWWIDGITGEAHMFMRNTGFGCGNFDTSPFDMVDPDAWYCGANTLNKVKYHGNHLEPQTTPIPGSFIESEMPPQCTGPANKPANPPCLAVTPLTGNTTMSQLLAAFDPTFDPGKFQGWQMTGVESGVIELRVYRGTSPSSGAIGWVIAFDPNRTSNGQPNSGGCVGAGKPGCIVAAMPSWSRPGARWCVLKSISPVNTTGWMQISPLYWGGPGDTNPGQGPYQVVIRGATGLSNKIGVPGGVTACPSNRWNATQCSTITVSGEPFDDSPCKISTAVCGAPETGAPGEIGAALPGDDFTVEGTNEVIRLIQKTGSTWIIQRAFAGNLANVPTGAKLYVTCNTVTDGSRWGSGSGEYFWNYAKDPHGLNNTGTTIMGNRYGILAHYFWQNTSMATPYTLDPRCVSPWPGSGCYQTQYGSNLVDLLSTPPTAIIENNPQFAGKSNLAGVNNTQSHPWGAGQFAPTLDREFFWDGRPFNGDSLTGNPQSPLTHISGSLWKAGPTQLSALDRKFLPTYAEGGAHALRDISSPVKGNVIGDSQANWYHYCVVLAGGECRTGSQPGEVYLNVPYVNEPFCFFPGQAWPLGEDVDLCIGNNAFAYNGIFQIGIKWTDMTSKYQRLYTRGLMRGRYESVFWHGHSLANGRWMLLYTSWANNIRNEWFAVKLNPPPPVDSIARNTFIPVRVTLQPPAGTKVDNAIIEFGYSEYGAASAHRCTTRAEACAVGRAANPDQVDAANPFYFEKAESAALVGTPCSNGCSIAVPAISQRVVYGRVTYRDARKNVVAQSVPFVIATP